jgi:cytidyltransferase-like protein
MHSPDIPPRSSGIVYCFDLDGTICTNVENSDYASAKPDIVVVNEINRLYDMGNIIKIMTARGSVSKVDHTELTKNQLDLWGLKYHELIMNKKPYADYFIDDRGWHIDDWKIGIPQTRGIIAGAFDVIHPGYIKMFIDAKTKCTHLTVALHVDPSTENNKEKPVLDIFSRKEILMSIKYVDDVLLYENEQELFQLLKNNNFDIRFFRRRLHR